MISDIDDIEPRIREILHEKRARRLQGPYSPRTVAQVSEGLSRLLAEEGGAISDVRRMSGGASKEQFLFMYDGPRGREQLVLRMDPLEGLLETCRRREAQVLRAMRDVVPVPPCYWVDDKGTFLPHPGLIYGLAEGVDRPPLSGP